MAKENRIERREQYEKASRELREKFSDVSGRSLEIDRIVTCGDGTIILKGPAVTLRIRRVSRQFSTVCFCDETVADLASELDSLHVSHVQEIPKTCSRTWSSEKEEGNVEP